MSNEGFVEYTPEGRPPRSWDFFLTIFLLLLLLILTGVFVNPALGGAGRRRVALMGTPARQGDAAAAARPECGPAR